MNMKRGCKVFRRRVARNASLAALTDRRNALLRLRADVEKAYLETVSSGMSGEEMSACVRQFEHHIQKAESDQTHESAYEKMGAGYPANNCASDVEQTDRKPQCLAKAGPGKHASSPDSQRMPADR